VLGFYDDGKLHYAGRTGTGFTQDIARRLFHKLMAFRSNEVPFETIPAEERGVRKPVWAVVPGHTRGQVGQRSCA
jgi:bifunctional non-homologous end joining protein LigD